MDSLPMPVTPSSHPPGGKGVRSPVPCLGGAQGRGKATLATLTPSGLGLDPGGTY